MTQFLPPNLLLLFQPRPPIPYIPPIDKPKLPAYSGVAQFVQQFEDPATVDYTQFRPIETKDQRRDRKRKERQVAEEEKIEKLKAACMNDLEDLVAHNFSNFSFQGTHTRAPKLQEMRIRLCLCLELYVFASTKVGACY
jgi:U1 small nuclear ribonucleoprotein of 70kDa MW N terminal